MSPTPRERLAAVHESTAASKAAAEATGAQDLAQFSELVPGGLVALAARTASQFQMATRTTPLVNTVVTNVPGSQVPLYFAGARLVTFFGGAGVADGMGLLHGVSSYVGQLILSVVADRAMLPDPGHYADLLEQSFAELASATSAHRPSSNGERSRRRRRTRTTKARSKPATRDPKVIRAWGDEQRDRCTGPRSHPRRGRAAVQRRQLAFVNACRAPGIPLPPSHAAPTCLIVGPANAARRASSRRSVRLTGRRRDRSVECLRNGGGVERADRRIRDTHRVNGGAALVIRIGIRRGRNPRVISPSSLTRHPANTDPGVLAGAARRPE